MPEGAGLLQGVWGGDGGGISGDSHDDSAWEGGRGATELENPGHGGQATDIPNGLPGQGRPTELSGGGHRWVLPVLRYPSNLVIYHYPPFWVILMVILLIFIIQNYPNFF